MKKTEKNDKTIANENEKITETKKVEETIENTVKETENVDTAKEAQEKVSAAYDSDFPSKEVPVESDNNIAGEDAEKLKAQEKAAEKQAKAEAKKAQKEAKLETAKAKKEAKEEKAKIKKAAKAEKKAALTKKQKTARKIVAVLIGILALALVGAILLSEFWVPAPAAYVEPTEEVMEEIKLLTGDTYTIRPTLEDNERISTVESQDEDVVSVVNNTITAIGVYKTTVTVTTTEKVIPVVPARYENIVIFGTDIAPTLCNMRTYLRDFIGVEPITEPRTELRTLGIYVYPINVEGIGEAAKSEEDMGKVYLGESANVKVDLKEGEIILNAVSDNEDVASIKSKTDSDGKTTFSVKGETTGDANLTVTVGFEKFVRTSGDIPERVTIETRMISGEINVSKRPVVRSGGGAIYYGGGGGASGGGGYSNPNVLTLGQVQSICATINAEYGANYDPSAGNYSYADNVAAYGSYGEVLARVRARAGYHGRCFYVDNGPGYTYTIIIAY